MEWIRQDYLSFWLPDKLSGGQRDWKRGNAVTGIEAKVRATIICSRQRDRYFVAKMLFLIMILPARVRSDEDGANPMGLYLIAACRNFLVYFRKGNYYGWE